MYSIHIEEKEKKMKISIIIPVYNKEEYVAGCLQHVLNQNFDSFEVIAVDDGSTDKSGAICDEIANNDNRLKVIHTPNYGVTAARRIGVENAKGDYIMFVDSDDTLLPDALKSTYNIILKTNADEVIAYYKTQNGRIADPGLRGWTEPTFMIKELLGSRLYFCVLWGILFKKEILEGCLDTPREIRNGEDILMQIKVLAKKPKVYFIDKCIYLYQEGLPNDRKLTLEVEMLYDSILEKTLSNKEYEFDYALLHHKIKVYENFLNNKQFDTYDLYYKRFCKNINKEIPLMDRIIMLLPPRIAYFPVHYYKKFKGKA